MIARCTYVNKGVVGRVDRDVCLGSLLDGTLVGNGILRRIKRKGEESVSADHPPALVASVLCAHLLQVNGVDKFLSTAVLDVHFKDTVGLQI